MAVIAIYSLKGGVGKTSFAVNLAWASAQCTKRQTLLWDLDPQWAASFMLGHEPDKKRKARNIFADTLNIEEATLWTGIENLDLLPADSSLRSLDSLFGGFGKKRVAKLAGALSKNYARIILDCPPGLTETSDQMMRAADLIIVPVIPSPLSVRALDEVQAHLLAKHGSHVPILPVFSMVDRRRALHRTALDQDPKWPIIPMASAVEQMGVRRAPLGHFAPRSPAADAYATLWKGIERKLSRL